MKKKIMMPFLIILILFLIVASIITISKVVIVKDILKKVETNLDEKTNFSITRTNYYSDTIFSVKKVDTDLDNLKGLTTYFEFDYNKTPEITSKQYIYDDGKISHSYNWFIDPSKEEPFEAFDSVENVLTKDGDATNHAITFYIKDTLSFKNIFKYFITSEKIRNIDCYKIRLFSENSILYIDKDTGLLIREVQLGKDSNEIHDSYYSFDTVTDKTFDVYKELEANAKKDEETK